MPDTVAAPAVLAALWRKQRAHANAPDTSEDCTAAETVAMDATLRRLAETPAETVADVRHKAETFFMDLDGFLPNDTAGALLRSVLADLERLAQSMPAASA